MCQRVQQGDAIYNTPRELSALIGGPKNLRWFDHKDEMDWCLCCIDIPSSLDDTGLRWKPDYDPTLFIVEK